MCLQTGLSEAQAYKWGWDQKKKLGQADDAFYPSTDEFGGYSKHGFSQLESLAASVGIDINNCLKKLDLDFVDNLSPAKPQKAKMSTKRETETKEEEDRNFEENLNSLEDILITPTKKNRARMLDNSADIPAFTTATAKKPRSDSEKSKVLMSSINTEKLKCSEKVGSNKIDSDSNPSIKRRSIEGCHSAPPKQASIGEADFESFSQGFRSEPGFQFEPFDYDSLEFPEIEEHPEDQADSDQPQGAIGEENLFEDTSAWFQ